MPIPNEPVGSLPRPAYLQKAYADYDADVITQSDFIAAQDRAVRESLELMASTGQEFITDGEVRLSSFATYPLTDTFGGKGYHPLLSPDGITLAIFTDAHTRQLPRLTSGPFTYQNYAYGPLTLSKPLTTPTQKLKASVIAPSLLCLLYPLETSLPDYSREDFEQDLVRECIKDIKGSFAQGAERVTIDFTEARIALLNDPKLPWTCMNILPKFITLINTVLSRFPAAERANIGVHSCAGGDHCVSHSAGVSYTKLLPELLKLNAGYFLLSFSSEPLAQRTVILQSIVENLRPDAEGVQQKIFIGVTNPLDPRVESKEEVRDLLVEAAKVIGKERVGATDDCGFSPFGDDQKKALGGVDGGREIAREKMKNRVEGAKLASEVLGI